MLRLLRFLRGKSDTASVNDPSSCSARRGFTIIELLTVVFIIGLLTSVVLVSSTSVRKKARDDKRKADMHTVALGLEMYYAKNKIYPIKTSFSNSWSLLQSKLSPATGSSFVPSWPTDPLYPTGGYDSGYVYASNSSGTSGTKYILDATLENPLAGATGISGCTRPNTDFSTGACFYTGYYKYSSGKTHYRVSSK